MLPLFVWLSPAFPVGAYAYSHGLEWATEAGDVRDAATLAAWLDDLADHGAPRLDVTLFAAAWRAAADSVALADINALAIALAGSQERRLETTAQGTAFVTAARAAWPCPALEGLAGEAVAIPCPAAIRLSVVGQTDGQKLIAALTPRLAAMAAQALREDPESFGACAFRSEIAAMKHETQYSRLFRS